MSPAWASAMVRRNVSIPVTTAATVGRSPVTSTVSPTRTRPRLTIPVTTVPRPVIDCTPSTARRKGSSIARVGSGMAVSTASMSARMPASHSGSPARAPRAETGTTGTRSPS